MSEKDSLQHEQQLIHEVVKLAGLFSRVSKVQTKLTGQFSKANQALILTAHDNDEEDSQHWLQHSLQLRFDQLDVIQSLIKLNSSFCLALGINSVNSYSANLEHALHALGAGDLQNVLHYAAMITQRLKQFYRLQQHRSKQAKIQKKLIDTIEKAFKEFADEAELSEKEIKQYKKTAHKKILSAKGLSQLNHLEHELHSVHELQAQFQFSIEQLTEAFHKYSSLPKFGLIFNYISTLEGPISRFYTAQQNGVTQTLQLNHRLTERATPHQNLQEKIHQDVKLARTLNLFH